MLRRLSFGRDIRVSALLSAGHFLSHFYQLCLPPLFIVWQRAFDVSFAELGLATALMAGATALAQTPMGFLVDRYGARPFLVGGVLVMALSVAAMGLAGAFWQIAGLALLSGVGNAVVHPADYAIMTGSVDHARLGRSFSLHTFSGHVGFAASPPVMAGLVLAVGWRPALIAVGLVGVPMMALVLWQSRILNDRVAPRDGDEPAQMRPQKAGGRLLLTRPILMFFAFYMVTAMATAGIQSWLITILHQVHGVPLATASSSLTLYMTGMMSGVLVGGWFTDRSRRHLAFTVVVNALAAVLLFAVGVLPAGEAAILGMLFAAGALVGSSRTPRDVMVKDAAGPGQVGKVFGFVSAGLSLGIAIMPVPYGMLIDAGRPDLVLVVVAALLLASLVFVIAARLGSRRTPAAALAD